MNVAAGNKSAIIGFANDGYWGISVTQQTYTGSFWVKGAYEGNFTASFQSALTDDVFASVEVESKSVSDEWVEHEVVLIPEVDAPNVNNTFAITFDSEGATDGSLDFNLISLFPPTFKGRKNGMRIDIVEALEGFHPVSVLVRPCCRWSPLTWYGVRRSSDSRAGTCWREMISKTGGIGRNQLDPFETVLDSRTLGVTR